VFDYCLDESTGTFIRWGEKQQDKAKILAGGYTITPDVSFSYIFISNTVAGKGIRIGCVALYMAS
jgi:hypothetical protein